MNIHDATESAYKNDYAQGYVDGKNDAVCNIFEELEQLMVDGKIGGKYPAKVINPKKFAAFKKKHMEGRA